MRRKQRGTALVAALMIVALVSAIALVLSRRVAREIHASEAVLVSDQAFLYFQGMQDWAIHMLKENKHARMSQNSRRDRMHLKHFGPVVFGNAKITGVLDDAQSRFNLNSMANPYYVSVFSALLKKVLPEMRASSRYALENAVTTWIIGGGDNRYYLHQHPPRRIPAMPFASKKSLQLVEGFSAKLYHRLSPFVIALPRSMGANLETASIPVLSAYYGTLPSAAIAGIWHCERETALSLLDKDNHYCLDQFAPQYHGTTMVVGSDYYLLKADIAISRRHYRLQSLLRVVSDKRVDVVWQSLYSP